MIVHPAEWRDTGQSVSLEAIEEAIVNSLEAIDSNALALSGGVDSSLLLHYMAGMHPIVYAFTMGSYDDHPDVAFSRLVASKYPNVEHVVYIPTSEEMEAEKALGEENEGDAAVRLFYKFVSNYTDSIVTGDGIDEFMAGYYAHQENPTEEVYYDYLDKLQEEQLVPLDKSSGSVQVYLPYIDSKLVSLMSQIPLSKKVDKESRKKIIMALARGKVPDEAIDRRKRGFISALWDEGRLGSKDIEVLELPSITPGEMARLEESPGFMVVRQLPKGRGKGKSEVK